MRIQSRIMGGCSILDVFIFLIISPTALRAQDPTLPDGYLETRNAFVKALSASDLDAVESMLDPEGTIVFSMENGQSDMTLARWFGSFQDMVERNTRVLVEDLQSRSGGAGTTGWSWSTQKLTWFKAGSEEPAATATWYTTEVWQKMEGAWRVVHVHHSIAPSTEPAEK